MLSLCFATLSQPQFSTAQHPEILQFSMQLPRPLEYQIARTCHHYCFNLTSTWQFDIVKDTQFCNRSYWSDIVVSNVGLSCKTWFSQLAWQIMSQYGCTFARKKGAGWSWLRFHNNVLAKNSGIVWANIFECPSPHMNGVYISCDLSSIGDGLRVWNGLPDVLCYRWAKSMKGVGCIVDLCYGYSIYNPHITYPFHYY